MDTLTDKQKAILKYISDYVIKNQISPAIRDIARHFNINVGPIQRHLKVLKEKGYLNSTPRKARGLILSHLKAAYPIPVLGQVHAGMPNIQHEAAEGYIYTAEDKFKNDYHFALRIKGDSMTGSGIYENDIVIVRQQSYAEHNDIVAAIIDGEAVIKKLFKKQNNVHLEATNPDYKPIYSDNIQIIGKIVYLTRKV